MDVNALRTWGIAVTAVLMAGALMLGVEPRADAQPQAVIAQAAQPARAAPIGFIVRFRGSGPIARAQARAARGNLAQGQREIELQLRRQSDFAGLCFDRFTAGAAETVLRTCSAIVASERGRVQQQWLTRLRAMRAVEYVDANATVTQERAPG
jgi:hypothetical protein